VFDCPTPYFNLRMPNLKRCSLSGMPSLWSYSPSSRCGKPITTHTSPYITTRQPVAWHSVLSIQPSKTGPELRNSAENRIFQAPSLLSCYISQSFNTFHYPVLSIKPLVESSWNVTVHGDAREGKWRGNWRMERVASTLHTTSEHGVSSITTADAHTPAASSRLNWRPRRFKWTRPFRRKAKSGFCACAITFQLASTR
jgi:hypothetical protein